jgi:hypothetical protein
LIEYFVFLVICKKFVPGGSEFRTSDGIFGLLFSFIKNYSWQGLKTDLRLTTKHGSKECELKTCDFFFGVSLSDMRYSAEDGHRNL